MKILFPVVVLLLAGLAACSSPPKTRTITVEQVTPAQKPPKDHTSLFADAGKVSTKVVPDHILDLKALPGGSWAEYDVKGEKYQEFVIDTDSDQSAAFMLLDVKAQLANPQYISWMGGYFGMLGDKQVYCFSKRHYLAGIVGLPEAKADPLGRVLAAALI
jgi:hypothetical protein